MSNHQPESNDGDSLHQQDDGPGNDESQDEHQDVGVSSYGMEGYTPLNFNMNAFAMADDTDEEDGGFVNGGEVEGNDGDLFSNGYYHLGPPNRRINGVKKHAGEFASSAAHDDDSVSEGSDDLVPDNFQLLAEQALRGLDDEHRVTLDRSGHQETINSMTTSLENFIEDGQSNDPITDVLAETKEEAVVPAFEASFPSFKSTATTEQSVEKPIAPRKFPAAKMNLPQYDNTKSKSKTMDLSAIQKAMQSIRKSSPQFASTLDAGSFSTSAATTYKTVTAAVYNTLINSTCASIQERQNALQQQYTLSSHSIIPTAPLAAFRKNTLKAQSASHNLSRSATLSEALVRLWPLICFRKKLFAIKEKDLLTNQSKGQETTKLTKSLTIQIIGADGVECSSEDSVRNSVGAFVRWLDAALQTGALSDSLSSSEAIQHSLGTTLIIEFSGPNMPEIMVGKTVDLLPQTQSNPTSRGLVSATAIFHSREYHEDVDGTKMESAAADLTVAFNAGIW
jgi:hypothetical protein